MIVSLFNPEKQFQLERYEICMERQQPTRVTCFTNKSMTSKFEYSLGIGDEVATNHCPLVLNRTREINAQLFENQLTEPLRYLLDRPFKKQLIAADYLRFFLELALAWDLGLVVQTTKAPVQRENLFFIGNCRNALDQAHQIFNLKNIRWKVSWGLKQLVIYETGGIPLPVIPLAANLFQGQTERGIAIYPVPSLRPYHTVIWNKKREVIDRVLFHSATKNMIIRFASDLIPAGRRPIKSLVG
ncbi:MAG: hypothetical protein A2508_02565 [Candidatus Lambdaproteobacteria bacterium RIFOXYD12_FULL_49_8]|nr:MAG: hypothetical protein A2508_02565 [Candidatus Lambdaproteobacteria bacterium RIFOXYD12_FULL_49_8]